MKKSVSCNCMGYLFCDNNEAVLLPRYIFVRITLLTKKKNGNLWRGLTARKFMPVTITGNLWRSLKACNLIPKN